MNSFIENFKSEKLISKEEIIRLRNYIDSKYTSLSSKERAVILAKSIHTILNINLKQFSDENRDKIKDEIIRNTLAQNKDDIYKHDIFQTLIYLDDSQEGLLDSITKWVNENADDSFKDEDLDNYILALKQDFIKQEAISLEKKLNSTREIEVAEDTESIEDIIKVEEIPLLEVESLSSDKVEMSIDVEDTTNIIHNNIKNNINQFIKDLNKSNANFNEVIEEDISQDTINRIVVIFLATILIALPLTEIIDNKILNKEKETLSTNITQKLENNSVSNKESIDYSDLEYEHIPIDLRFKDIDEEALNNYLIEKNSLLAQEPYFTAIINSARDFNLNPLVLFSIAGHEQSFVPRDHELADKIANNPFNVFHSWEKYNTDIVDSSTIAARTVFNLLKERPSKENPFKWINRKYAEDPNWYKGVESIYNMLEKTVN